MLFTDISDVDSEDHKNTCIDTVQRAAEWLNTPIGVSTVYTTSDILYEVPAAVRTVEVDVFFMTRDIIWNIQVIS